MYLTAIAAIDLKRYQWRAQKFSMGRGGVISIIINNTFYNNFFLIVNKSIK